MARQQQRREYLPGWPGAAQRAAERVGWWPRLAAACVAGLALPLLGLGGFQLQVGIDSLVIALLAVGLNIVVGWAGLLDLGYVAFFGFGAYGFALLSSSQIGSQGIHLPAILSLPIVMALAAVLGLIVGWPSRRLFGDYLAIVTLFFGEAFVEFTNNVARANSAARTGSSASTRIGTRSASSSPPTRVITTCWSSCSWRRWPCCGCSRPPGPAGPGRRCGRTRWRRPR